MILLNSHHACAPFALKLQSFMISWLLKLLMKVHETSRKFMKVHESFWKFLKVLESSWNFTKVHESSWKFMKVHNLMNRTSACTATFFKRELMVSLFTLPPLWELQHLKFSPHELLPPWRPFESPRPKRLCAATHSRTIAPSGFHSLPHFIDLHLCFQVACPRSNLFFSFSLSRFYGAKRSSPGDALC